jgi:hypothetical protein
MLISLVIPSGLAAQDVGYNPNKIFVPNAETAIAIGQAVLVPIYGAANIRKEEPFRAIRSGDVWTVEGTLYCRMSWWQKITGGMCFGGTAIIKLSAKDGRFCM